MLQNGDLQAEIATQLAVLVAQHGHVPLVHLLDEFGADWEETDPLRGGSPLMHAANNGHTAAVTALLEVTTQHSVAWRRHLQLLDIACLVRYAAHLTLWNVVRVPQSADSSLCSARPIQRRLTTCTRRP